MNDPPRQDLDQRDQAAAAARRDPIDFAAAVEAHESPLLRYVLKLTGCQRELAEDVTQEVFLRLHRQVANHGDGSVKDLPSWLFKVAHNLAMDKLRKTKRHRRAHERVSREPANAESTNSGQLGELEHKEACARAMAEMDLLPPDLKQVLMLKILEGMTLRQIGEVTGLTVGNAGYRLNQALSELTMKLKQAEVI